MYEQAKIINDLRALGASHGTIESEMKRLRELEAMVFKDFRRYLIFYIAIFQKSFKDTEFYLLNKNSKQN